MAGDGRLRLVDDRLLGRILAPNRFVYPSRAPLGVLAGGLLADAIGVAPGLLVAAIGISAGALLRYRSPIPAVRLDASGALPSRASTPSAEDGA